jgi:RecA-family ATPase
MLSDFRNRVTVIDGKPPDPEAEQLISYTLFRTTTPTSKSERDDVEWRELGARIQSAPTYIDKQHCPLISLSEYGDLVSPKGCIRHAANVQRVFGGEFDYDGEKVSIHEAAHLLREARIKAVLYTSPSHKPHAPRWRVLLPFSEPALPEKRAEYVGRANRLLGGIASRESFTLSQSFYIGRVKGAQYEVHQTQGRCIDLAAEIEPLYNADARADGESKFDPTTDEELRAVIGCNDEVAQRVRLSRYDAMLKWSSRLAAKGMQADDVESVLIESLGPDPAPFDSNGGNPLKAARVMAESAVQKFADPRAPKKPAERKDPAGTQTTVRPTPPIDWPSLQGEPPPRVWWFPDWLGPDPTLTSGAGGAGKSRLWQALGTSLATGDDYLFPVIQPQRVLIWSCEENKDEIWRVQTAINNHLDVTMNDLGGLHIVPRRGLDNTLLELIMGKPMLTPLYMKELYQQVNDLKIDVLVLDNIAQVYGGNENDRHQVTMFVNAIAGLVPDRPFCPVLLGHVARSQGSEFSGSAAWENAVRMRWYLGATLPDQKPDEEDEPADPTVVYLCRRKANYTDKDWLRLRFENGLLVPDQPEGRRFDQSYRDDGAERVVLAAMPKLVAAGLLPTDARNGGDYLPAQIVAKGYAQGYSKTELTKAMHRLMGAGRLKREKVGTYSNRSARMGLIVV